MIAWVTCVVCGPVFLVSSPFLIARNARRRAAHRRLQSHVGRVSAAEVPAGTWVTNEVDIYDWYASGGMGGNDELVEQLLVLSAQGIVLRMAAPSHRLAAELRARDIRVTEHTAGDGDVRPVLVVLLAWLASLVAPLGVLSAGVGLVVASLISIPIVICRASLERIRP